MSILLRYLIHLGDSENLSLFLQNKNLQKATEKATKATEVSLSFHCHLNDFKTLSVHKLYIYIGCNEKVLI